MAFRTVGELKLSVAGLLQGTNLNRVTNVDGAIERGARTLLQQADVPEASGIQNLTLYGGVDFYAINPLIFGGAINLILPQGQVPNWTDGNVKVQLDTFSQQRQRLSNGYMVTVQYNKGVPLLGIASPNIFPQAILDPMNATDGWVAGGTASGLTTDTTNYYQQPAALRFTVTGVGTGTITKTESNPSDLSTYQGVGVAFLAFQIPSGTSATDLATLSLKLGSDSGNYSLVTDSTGFLGAWTSGEWLLAAFDFSASSTAGTPDWSAIDYVQVLVGTLGTITNFRAGGLWLSLPCPHNLYYQTAAIFQNVVTGVISNVISADSDLVLLSDPAFALLEYESAITIAFQNGGSTAAGDVALLNETLHGLRARNGAMIQAGLYDRYIANNPSSELRTIGSYYELGDGTGYNRNW